MYNGWNQPCSVSVDFATPAQLIVLHVVSGGFGGPWVYPRTLLCGLGGLGCRGLVVVSAVQTGKADWQGGVMRCVRGLTVDPRGGASRGPDDDDSDTSLCKSLLCPRGQNCFSIRVVRHRPSPQVLCQRCSQALPAWFSSLLLAFRTHVKRHFMDKIKMMGNSMC